MERDVDVLAKYRAVTNKLKKRFLKKPNLYEGSYQFGGLAKSLKQQESPQYAAFCFLAQARCEQSLSNPAGETQALTEAARSFIQAHADEAELHCITFGEHLTAAINCFSHAIRVHIETGHTALAASLSTEVGHSLKRFDKPGEAMIHFSRAAELQAQCPLDCLHSLGRAASCKIETRDYDGSLTVFTEMAYLAQEKGASPSGEPIRAFGEMIARCEISRVLLLMLLQPTPQRIRPEHAQTLEKYAWESNGEDSLAAQCMEEDLFLLLQSVVMACQSRELKALRALQADLWPYLSAEQNQLLHLVIKELTYPSGEGL